VRTVYAVHVPPSYLPVIRVVTDTDGHSMLPADELRVIEPLVAEFVTGDGPDRIELRAAPRGYAPPSTLAFQPEQTSLTADADAVIAIAPMNSPTLITSVSGLSGGGLTAHASNYRKIAFYDVGPLGLAGPQLGPFFNSTTQPSPTGTGDWSAAAVAFTWTPVGGYPLAAGHALLATFGKVGSGVAFPGVFWRIT
jgi:hypothetical protein